MRLKQIQENGILLREQGSEVVTATPVRVVERIEPEEAYDWALVIVRNNPLDGVLEMLKVNDDIPNVLFMLNNTGGPAATVAAPGSSRVLPGFSGAGGKREGGDQPEHGRSRMQLTTRGATTLFAPFNRTNRHTLTGASPRQGEAQAAWQKARQADP